MSYVCHIRSRAVELDMADKTAKDAMHSIAGTFMLEVLPHHQHLVSRSPWCVQEVCLWALSVSRSA